MKNVKRVRLNTPALIIAAIVACAGAGVTGWFLYQKHVARGRTLTQIVAQARDKIAESVPTVSVTGAADGNANGQVSYKVAGYTYFTTVTSRASINYAPKTPVQPASADQEASARRRNEQTLRPARDAIVRILHNSGFKEVPKYPAKEFVGDGMAYERSGDVCAVNFDGFATGVSCAAKVDLINVAKAVKPFVEAYTSAKTAKPAATAFGMLETGTGTTQNDPYALVITGTGAAYFYKENGKWTYFTTAYEGIGCTDIAGNPSAAKAFATICEKPGVGY
jgi:hypothetical protein